MHSRRTEFLEATAADRPKIHNSFDLAMETPHNEETKLIFVIYEFRLVITIQRVP